MSEARTMSSKPARSATIAMISSGRLPNVAFSRPPTAGPVRAAAWNPEKEGPWFEELSVVDAVVHLAGATVARRWSDDVKRSIERSRVEATRLLVEAIGRAKHKPTVLVSASATGFASRASVIPATAASSSIVWSGSWQ